MKSLVKSLYYYIDTLSVYMTGFPPPKLQKYINSRLPVVADSKDYRTLMITRSL